MIKSSEISKIIHRCVKNVIDLAVLLHITTEDLKSNNIRETENFLEYLRNETEANTLTAQIDEDLTELGLFFDSINPLKERYELIKTLYLSQFKSQTAPSEEEISEFLAGTGIGETDFPETQDDLVDVDAPFPSVNSFTNIPEDAYGKGKK